MIANRLSAGPVLETRKTDPCLKYDRCLRLVAVRMLLALAVGVVVCNDELDLVRGEAGRGVAKVGQIGGERGLGPSVADRGGVEVVDAVIAVPPAAVAGAEK